MFIDRWRLQGLEQEEILKETYFHERRSTYSSIQEMVRIRILYQSEVNGLLHIVRESFAGNLRQDLKNMAFRKLIFFTLVLSIHNRYYWNRQAYDWNLQ